MKMLFLDFETTGFPIQADLTDQDQPHLVSAAMILRDGKKRLADICLPVQCPVESDEGAFEVHGLTKAFLDENGVPPGMVARLLYRLFNIAGVIISHNVAFDHKIANIAMARYCRLPYGDGMPAQFCTMRASQQLMKGMKTWSLDSATKHFLDLDPRDGRHTSYQDVRRCEALFDYFWENGHTPFVKPDEV